MGARSTRRLIAWLLCCAMLFGAVLPVSAHGRGGVEVPLAPLCSLTGDGAQSGGDGAPPAAPPTTDCPCCLASCGPVGIPAPATRGLTFAGGRAIVVLPVCAEGLPPAPRATTSPPRAPPA